MGVPSGRHGETWADEKRRKKAEKEAHWRQVCALVDRRDKGHCRVCDRHCSPTAIGMLDRAERHHVTPRSQMGPDETWNLATLCRACHDARHTKGTLRVTGNADEVDQLGRFCGLTIERETEGGWDVVKVA